MEHNKDLFDKYFESTYGRVNFLDEDNLRKAAEDFEARYKEYLPKNKEAAILDAGCGSGQFLYYLKGAGYKNFKGIDISPQQVEFCRKNITDQVEEGDILEKLSAGKTYDVIVCNDVAEHIRKEEILHFFKSILSALNEDGVFILRVPNMSNPLSSEARYCDFTHEIGFTARSLYQVLWTAGFKNIEVLPPKEISVRSLKNLIRKTMVSVLQNLIKFAYYIQDYTVPYNLDKNIVAVARKN